VIVVKSSVGGRPFLVLRLPTPTGHLGGVDSFQLLFDSGYTHTHTHTHTHTTIGIVESEVAIKEAKEVSKLTELAFFFIPLTFVAGVCGMNIAVSALSFHQIR
jgi:hypothetical protein